MLFRLAFIGVFFGLVGVAIVLGAGLVTYKTYARGLVPPTQLGVNRPSTGAVILDRNGKLLYRYVDDKDGIRDPVTLDKVNPAFLAATIATEDPDFYTNPGVSARGLERAVSQNIGPFIHGETLAGSGGSSITQQLVKNLYFDQQAKTSRDIDRKVREMVFSLELTKEYAKTQILQWYVNQISYGGQFNGVEAASQAYFGKPASDLTLGEASLLAGIPQSPVAYDPETNLQAALQRRNEVLDLMSRYDSIQVGDNAFYHPNPQEIADARNAPVNILPVNFPIQAPHFVLTYVQPELEQLVGKDALLHNGLVVTTSLDLDLQNAAQDGLEHWIEQYEAKTNDHNGAELVIQPKTGELLAMVGSRDYWRDDIDGNVNNLLALNSPGSSFKPFVYLLSFLQQHWTPGTPLQDTPVTYKETNGTTFSPTDPDHSYHGTVSLRTALGNSMNIVAFKTAQQVGVGPIVDFAHSLGFSGFNGTYGPAIAIGGVDLRGIDLTYAYAMLANNGAMIGQDTFAPDNTNGAPVQPIAVLKIDSPNGTIFNVDDHRTQRQVVPPEYPYMITDILSDPSAVCITFGCGGVSIPGYKVAVKTGTSQPYDQSGPNKDSIGETWAFGYTPDWVVGVWAGNADNAPLTNILSTDVAWHAMRDTLLAAYNGGPETPFTRPPGIVTKQVCQTIAPPPPDPNTLQLPQSPFVAQRQPGLPFFFQQQPLAIVPPAPPQQICTSDIGVR